MKVWQLADLAEWTGVRPSDLLNLPGMGVPLAVCLDFDLAVRALKRWADRREAATHQVRDHDPKPAHPMKSVPTYPTLADVLGLDDDVPAMTPADQGKAHDLAAAMASGSVDWEAFGLL